MARDRFGFLERHGFVNRSIGALQHLALGRRSTPRVQTNRVKCDVVDSKLRFNCVSTAPRLDRWSGCFSGYYRRHDNALLGLSSGARERSATAGCGTWRNNHPYEGISDAPRASGTLME